MSAPITEAHRELARNIMFYHTPKGSATAQGVRDAAQLIADSEARAVEQANAQVESLLSAAKNAIPASEHPAEPTVENWAWQMRNLGEDRRLVYADRDKLRAEVEHLRESEKAFCEDRNTQRTRAERAEAELKKWSLLNLWGGTPEIVHAFVKGQQARIHAAQDVEAELKVSRAIVSKIWVQLGSPTYEQLKGRSIYDLIDELKAELATERARLDWLEKARPIAWALGSEECGEYWILTDTGEKHPEEAEEFATLRAAIDAAMKEGAK